MAKARIVKRGSKSYPYYTVMIGDNTHSVHETKADASKVTRLINKKVNPAKMPKGKFFKVEAARVNRDGSVTLKVPDSVVKRNPALRRNIAGGMMTATGFHPFRSSPDYDPDRAEDEYGARTDNKGFTRTRKGTTKKKAAPKRKPATKKKKATAKKKRR